tara:strand:- start:154 stop:477 length:324 start_codon:yes stop_codon:yes gene_type:complete
MNMNKNISIYKMKFDPRYAILAVLLILAVVKITMKKEPYMCGGKREGYKSSGGPKMAGRKPPIMGNKAVKKEGYCSKCGAGGQTYGKPCNCKDNPGSREGYCSSCGN